MAIELLLWMLFAAIGYTYGIYPLIVLVAMKMKGSTARHVDNTGELPSVSLVFAAYNEQQVLDEKIRNMTESEYPPEKIEFIIGSDGSTDQTEEILDHPEHSRIESLISLKFRSRRGKAAVLNDLVAKAKGDIVVFTDANTMYSRDTIKLLVSSFQDPDVGGVCGELILHNAGNSVGGFGESTYWNYENSLKSLESGYRTIVGATGGVYAIRRALFRSLPTDKVVTDDFLIPVQVVSQGYSMKYDPRARAYEQTSDSVEAEFKRRVRISASNFNGISEFIHLLNPRYGFVAFSLWSHKIVRWCTPFFLVAILILTAVLATGSPLYRLLMIGESIVIGIGIFGFIAERAHAKIGILGYPYYFIAMNGALLLGFLKYLAGKQKPVWDTIR